MSSRMLQLLHETSSPSPTAPGAIRRCISAAAQWQGRDDAGCSTSGNFESFLREFSLIVPIPVPGISKILRCAKTIHVMETPWKTACEKLHRERMSYRCSWTCLLLSLRGTSSKVGYRYITLFRRSFFFYKNSYLIRILRLKFVKF